MSTVYQQNLTKMAKEIFKRHILRLKKGLDALYSFYDNLLATPLIIDGSIIRSRKIFGGRQFLVLGDVLNEIYEFSKDITPSDERFDISHITKHNFDEAVDYLEKNSDFSKDDLNARDQASLDRMLYEEVKKIDASYGLKEITDLLKPKVFFRSQYHAKETYLAIASRKLCYDLKEGHITLDEFEAEMTNVIKDCLNLIEQYAQSLQEMTNNVGG